MPKKTKAKSYSKILKCIINCLEEQKFPHVLNWMNRAERIFVIQFIHKNNPTWNVRYLDLFKELDGLSKKKLESYIKKSDYESACKVRCKSNLKKLCEEGVLSFCGKKKENKSKFSVFYKINDFSGKYLKEPEVVRNENVCDVTVSHRCVAVQRILQDLINAQLNTSHSPCLSNQNMKSLDSVGNFPNFSILENKNNVECRMDYSCVDGTSTEGLVTNKNIENNFYVEKSIPFVGNPVSHGDEVSEHENTYTHLKNNLEETGFFELEDIQYLKVTLSKAEENLKREKLENMEQWKILSETEGYNVKIMKSSPKKPTNRNVKQLNLKPKISSSVNGKQKRITDEKQISEVTNGLFCGVLQTDLSMYQNVPGTSIDDKTKKDSYSIDEMNAFAFDHPYFSETSYNLNNIMDRLDSYQCMKAEDIQRLDHLEGTDDSSPPYDPFICCGSSNSCTCGEQAPTYYEFEQLGSYP